MFNGIPLDQHKFVKAGLQAIIDSSMDTKISVIHGNSGIGKSTGLIIIGMVLGDSYHFSTTVNDFINDRATRSNILGKRLLVFQDMPKTFKDFSTIKSVAGEHLQTVRGFQQANVSFVNKLKIWGSANYLTIIPEEEKDPMFTQRLSLIENTSKDRFKQDKHFAENIVKDEGEEILSYLVNLKDEECEYEDRDPLRERWESIQSPEIAFLNKYYDIDDETVSEVPVTRVLRKYKECNPSLEQRLPLDTLISTMKTFGYSIKYGSNIIINIVEKKVIEEEPEKETGRQTEL